MEQEFEIRFEGNNVEFETDEDLPFELTEEMKDYMYELACTN